MQSFLPTAQGLVKSPLFLKRAAHCLILKPDVASVWVVANKSITAPSLVVALLQHAAVKVANGIQCHRVTMCRTSAQCLVFVKLNALVHT